ncbi:MAG: hypothetical protein K2V38_29515, partial [Gemmataceae bacterium]|nr:hypothetical protein [Gemmataceae bacterium]
SGFERSVRSALHEFGYTLHPTKGWRVFAARDEPEVTGVVLADRGGLRLPERILRVMWELGHSAEPHDIKRLEGYEAYAAAVYRKARTRGKPSAPTTRVRPPVSPPPAPRPPAPDEDGDVVPF